MSHNNTCFQIELPLSFGLGLSWLFQIEEDTNNVTGIVVDKPGDRPVYNDDHSDSEHGG